MVFCCTGISFIYKFPIVNLDFDNFYYARISSLVYIKNIFARGMVVCPVIPATQEDHCSRPGWAKLA
jgi:hypothetical protein